MIQFRVNDTYLDLPTGFNLSLKYTNSCFAFDKMELNRSQEFSIPATQKNNKLFQFANNPSNNGDFIRRVYVAELYFDGGVIRGELRIIKFDAGSGYNAIFTWGELTLLKTMKEAGNIASLLGQYNMEIQATSTEIISAYQSPFPTLFDYHNFNFIKYLNGTSSPLTSNMDYSPTISLKYLCWLASWVLGVNVDFGNYEDICKSVGLILAGNKRKSDVIDFEINGNARDGITITTLGDLTDYIESTISSYKWQNSGWSGIVLWYKTQLVHTYRAKHDIKIKKKTGAGDNITIIGENEMEWVMGDRPLGNYKFPKILQNNSGFDYSSEIKIKRGQIFTFVRVVDWSDSSFAQWWTKPFDTNITLSDLTIEYANSQEVELNTDYPYTNNLPDVTIIDILKTYANLLHCGIDYSVETNTISFFNFNFNKVNAKKLEGKVVSLKSIDRKFSDYAQVNEVIFKSEEYVVSKSKIVYRIDNQTLPKTKTLYTIPFSDGDIDANGNVLVKDFDLSVNPPKKTAKQATICIASPTEGHNYLKHISKLGEYFVLPNTLYSIVMSSTTIVLSIICQPKYFLSIKNTDTFEYRSIYYCCLSATYSNGIAELTLVKI
jgi:hypothetical protein